MASCENVLRDTRGAAWREFASIKYHSNFELLENCDEATLGICATISVALIFWVGILPCISLIQPELGPSKHLPVTVAELRLQLEAYNRTPEELFASCRELNGPISADLACFTSKARAINVSGAAARFAFMQLDCNRDFWVELAEVVHALMVGRFACESFTERTSGRSTTAPSAWEVVAATTTTTATVQEVAEMTDSTTGSVTSSQVGSLRATTSAASTSTTPTSRTTTTTETRTISATTTTLATSRERCPPLPPEPPLDAGGGQRSSGGESTTWYLVDNSELHARSRGLGYRASRETEDRCEGHLARWGSDVAGSSVEQGWVQVGGQYLPTELNGHRVLAPKVGMGLQLQHLAEDRLSQESLEKLRAAVQQEIADAVGVPSDRARVELLLQPAAETRWREEERRAQEDEKETEVSARATIAAPGNLSRSEFLAQALVKSPCERLRRRLPDVAFNASVALRSSAGVIVSSCRLGPSEGGTASSTTTIPSSSSATSSTTPGASSSSPITTTSLSQANEPSEVQDNASLVREIGRDLLRVFRSDVAAFTVLDEDVDGFVSAKELSDGIGKHLNLSRSGAEYFAALDTDQDARLAFAELQATIFAAVSTATATSTSTVFVDLVAEIGGGLARAFPNSVEAFAALDADESGFVEQEEFLAGLREHLSLARPGEAYFGALDADQDKKLDFAELERSMLLGPEVE